MFFVLGSRRPLASFGNLFRCNASLFCNVAKNYPYEMNKKTFDSINNNFLPPANEVAGR